MKLVTITRLFLLAALMLSFAACRSEPTTAATPEAAVTDVATVQATSTVIPASLDTATQTVTTEAATPAPSLAEQARARKPLIAEALAAMELPEQGDVVASVNGKEITVDELREYMTLRMEGLAGQYAIDWAQAEIEPLVIQVQSEVLEQLIEMQLISQGADKAGVVVDEAELAGLTHEVQASIVEGQGYASWEDYLDTVSLSQASFDEILRQSLLVDGLILAQTTPTEVEQVHARHILVTDPELAADLAERLAAGEDFAELAKANSEDTGTALNGGDLDWFPRGMMVTEFEDAAFALGIGETSGVITTTYGFHIIQVLDKGPHALSEAARQQMQQGVFIDWLDAQRSEADIQRFVLKAVG